jgi:O-Antigen ligase
MIRMAASRALLNPRIAAVTRPVMRFIYWWIDRQRWVWLLPIPFYEFIRHEQLRLHQMTAAIIAVWLVVAIARRPAVGLIAMVVLLPFDTYLLAALLRIGVPAAVIRPLRLWQYGIAIGLAFAAARRFRQRRQRFDSLDKIVLAYLALGSAYLVLPHLFVGNAVGAYLPFYSRELGWRSDVFYAALFLIVRHLHLRADEVERAVKGLLMSGGVVAGIAVFEFFDKGSWNHFAVKVVRVTRYQQVVLNYVPSQSFNPNSVLAYGTSGGHSFVRVGSVLDYETLSFYMALCLGVAAEIIARARAKAWLLAAVPIMGLALLVTQTRSGLIAGAVAVLVGLRAQIGRSIVQRLRLSLTIALVVVMALPFVLFSHVGHRFLGDTSNSLHHGAFNNGVTAMQHHPLGRGLATSAGAGQQVASNSTGVSKAALVAAAAGEQPVLVTESQWLEIGTQLGFIGLAVFAAMSLMMIKRLRPRSPSAAMADSAMPGAGARNALIGLLVGGTFLQPFINVAMSFTVFALVGMGVGLIDDLDRQYGLETSPSGLPPLDGRSVATIVGPAADGHAFRPR